MARGGEETRERLRTTNHFAVLLTSLKSMSPVRSVSCESVTFKWNERRLDVQTHKEAHEELHGIEVKV